MRVEGAPVRGPKRRRYEDPGSSASGSIGTGRRTEGAPVSVCGVRRHALKGPPCAPAGAVACGGPACRGEHIGVSHAQLDRVGCRQGTTPPACFCVSRAQFDRVGYHGCNGNIQGRAGASKMENDLVGLMQALINTAEGRVPADVLFTNARIVDVYRLRVVRGQVAVKHGCIAGVLFEGRDCEDASVPAWEAERVVDCGNRYLAPGFIDGHLHIESSNIRPSEYARMALARGTTTAIADSHEIANVCGLDGLAFMIEDAQRAPLDIKFMMPSCVPALPDEQAGAVITAADMEAFMDEYRGAIFGLGEMMNLPGVYGADEETCHRIAVGAQTVSGQVDGHAPMTAGQRPQRLCRSGRHSRPRVDGSRGGARQAVPRHVHHAARGYLQP